MGQALTIVVLLVIVGLVVLKNWDKIMEKIKPEQFKKTKISKELEKERRIKIEKLLKQRKAIKEKIELATEEYKKQLVEIETTLKLFNYEKEEEKEW